MSRVDYFAFVAKRIAQLRAQKGVSAHDMSYSIDFGKNYVRNVENMRSTPSLPALFAMCDYLGVTLQEFFDAENKNPKAARELHNLIKHLDKEQIGALTLIVKSMRKLDDKQ